MASVVGTFTVDPRSRAAAKRRARSEGATGWAFVSPSVVIILGLSVVPVLWSLLLSFQVNDLVSPSEWVGLANYKALVKEFWTTADNRPAAVSITYCVETPT